MTSASVIDKMIEALGFEADAIKRSSRSSVLELRGGIKQGAEGSDTLYSFPLSEEPNLRDDLPVKVVLPGGAKEVSGTVVSVRNGVLTVALTEDIGPRIPLARLTVNDSFLIERLRDKLIEVKRGETTFNTASATAVLENGPARVGHAEVPEAVFALGVSLNEMQRTAVLQSAGSSLLYLWGPPGTGKTSTLAAIVHALYLQGKRILVVSNTNIAVDTALERIGDRLCVLPEFHEAAVLRFGHIASRTLREKYESQVEISKVADRHSAALVERRNDLAQEAVSLKAFAVDAQSALTVHSRIRALQSSIEQAKQQYPRLQSELEQQRREIGSLTAGIDQAREDLVRVKSMGAIRRLFSGLNTAT